VCSTTTHCNALQRTATYCNTLQHTATHGNTLHHTATQVMHSAAADGAVSAEEMLHIQLVQKKSVTLAAQVVSP